MTPRGSDDRNGVGTLTGAPLKLTRAQIIAFRRSVGALDERLPRGRRSLRVAAWAGLQDSMPRAALLSIHARVEGTRSDALDDPSLVQIWGPRYSAYVVAARDLAVFTLGRHPDDEPGRRRAERAAARLAAHLRGREMPYGEAGHAIRIQPNSLRYGATTGTILMRWDGARQPTVWTVPAPDMDPQKARLELARRYLHVFGPSTAGGFARWAGLRRGGATTFASLAPEVTGVRTPLGEAWILAADEETFRVPTPPATGARLLPSGDAYLLLGDERELLVPDAGRRAELWPSRVWPGGVLLDGDVVGTWRRSDEKVTVSPWRHLSRPSRDAVEREAESVPLPGVEGRISVRWQEP